MEEKEWIVSSQLPANSNDLENELNTYKKGYEVHKIFYESGSETYRIVYRQIN